MRSGNVHTARGVVITQPATWMKAVRFPVAIAAGLLGAAASLTVPSAGQPASGPPFAVTCPQSGAAGNPGAAASLGLDSRGAATPVWSAELWNLEAAADGLAFGAGNCVVGADMATGRVEWTSGSNLGAFGLVADSSTVLVATGVQVGQAPAMEASVIDGLTAYDPRTGAERWSVVLPDDGQQFPAALIGGVVVVSEANGSVLGLSERDGRRLWRDPAPSGCAGGEMDSISPDARTVGAVAGTGRAAAAVAYSCPGGGGIAEVDAASGQRLRAWEPPEGWAVVQQQAVAVTTGAPGGDAVAVPIDLVAPSNAPPTVAPAPGPSRLTSIASPNGSAPGEDVVMLDPSSGRPRWDLEGLPVSQTVTVVGGAGSLCAVTDVGTDCRAAVDGAPRWSEAWPGSNATVDYPALNCVDLSVLATPCVVASAGRMFVVTATGSAPAYPLQPGPPTPAGAFLLTELELATGRTVASLTLPSFNNPYTDHGVSLFMPPAVLVAAAGLVLVSPQFEDTGVVEAFAFPPES